MLTETVETPMMKLSITVEGDVVTAVDFQGAAAEGTGTDTERQVMEEAKKQVYDYFQGSRERFDLPIRMSGTAFQQQVWNELLNIPFGQAISYQELAVRIGNPKAVRAVGQANRRNPLAIVVPCHRVIGKDQTLKGYAGNQTPIKEWLLTHEKFL